MSRTCDWKDVKDGEIFKLVAPISNDFSYNVAYLGPDNLYSVSGGYIHNFPSGMVVARHSTHSVPPYGARQITQPVITVEADEIPVETMFRSLTGRVNNLTGSDPEVFVIRGKEKKTLLPAFKFLPLKKDAGSGKGGYRDGFAAEFYTPPATCHGFFIDDLRAGLKNILSRAQVFDRTSSLTIKNTFTIPKITMSEASDEDVALGCMPSENAYGDNPQLPPNAKEFLLRFAGGHVHLGMSHIEKERAVAIVKACDVLVGIPAVAIFADVDTPVRRQFYGRAGEYRFPKHGLEYRTLSNAWLADPALSHLILNMMRMAAKVGNVNYTKYLNISEEQVREIINFCDVKAARKFVLSNLKGFFALMKGEGLGEDASLHNAFKKIIEGGVQAIFPDFEDLEKNWKLNGVWNSHSNGDTAMWGYVCRNMKVTG